MATVDVQAARDLAPARHAAAPAARGARCPRSATSAASSAPERRPVETLEGEVVAAARARGRGLRGARARHARLRREERLRARRARALGRHRLDARRAASRSTRSGADRVTCVDDALALLLGGHARRRARARRATSASSCSSCRSRRRWSPTSELLAYAFEGREPDITEENLQARIRGNLLMALSNKFGWLVLTTGNKSEISVGYSTLYGDTPAASRSSRTCRRRSSTGSSPYRNERDPESPVRRRSSTRPPSAELRDDQADTDSLPRLRRRSTRSSRPTSRRTPTASSSRSWGCPRRRRAGDLAGRPRRVQAPPGAAGHQDHAARVRP